MSRPFIPYVIPKLYEIQGKPCVYKLSFNGKYVIVKAKDNVSSIAVIQKSLNQFLKGSEAQRNKDGLYYHFFNHVAKTKKGEFLVELIEESDNPYILLKKEQQELDKSLKDKSCLNNATEAYIPQFNDLTGMYGWIPKVAVLNFKKWLKNRSKSNKSQ